MNSNSLDFHISHVYLLRQDLSHHTIIFTYWPWPLGLTYFSKTLTSAITFKAEDLRLSYCIYAILVTRPFMSFHNFFYLVTLTLMFDLLFKNCNLGHNLRTVRDRAFIFHVYSLWLYLSRQSISDWEEIFANGPFSAFFNDFEIFYGPFLIILHTLWWAISQVNGTMAHGPLPSQSLIHN